MLPKNSEDVINTNNSNNMNNNSNNSNNNSNNSNNSNNNSNNSNNTNAHTKEATYPLPQHLQNFLEKCASKEEEKNIKIDDIETSISNILKNSVQALDVSSSLNTKQKRTIRMEANQDNKEISILDLGIGMTRADLINLLGIGRELSDRCSKAWLRSSQQQQQDDEEDSEEGVDNSETEEVVCCTCDDIGGFYATLCSIGLSVTVGTKSKYDDFYEFRIEAKQSNGNKNNKAYSKFCITRPLQEGQAPSIESGHDQFSDVRGDCGTRVTIQLNERGVAAGLLEEQTVLKPMVGRILMNVTSHYQVAFKTDDNHEEEENQCNNNNTLDDLEDDQSNDLLPKQPNLATDTTYKTVKERSKYIPLRLSLGERKMLRLVEASMKCTDYTNYVDHLNFKTPPHRTHAQLKAITAILRGMVTSCDYAAGQKVLAEGNYLDYEVFFAQMFEIARRHKIMNPEKMRENYGKFIYVLQDAVSTEISNHLGFSCKGPVQTVYNFLQLRNGLALLDDPHIEIATQEVLALRKTRPKIASEIKRKEKAVDHIKIKYRTQQLSSEDIHLCLYSICDNNSFLNSNRLPIDTMIRYLHDFFAPNVVQPGYSLAIINGQDGARLSHSHDRQYYFALQSLTLWRDIIDDMFRLWHMAEEDLLSTSSVSYKLTDTGQGYQRIQQSPRTYKAMQQILLRVQSNMHTWIGSSVIHLGDHNVPNALVFIDKYTQVPRILSPIVSCIENLERIYNNNDGIKYYINTTFGGLDQIKKDLLHDFFKSAFDGSGADNFYDAGSCIDGRLTSAWNWCSQLNKKKYFYVFKLTGFIGFDGEFK